MKVMDVLENVITQVNGKYFGKYKGTVKDNSDPTGRGRLLVSVPKVLKKTQVWALPCAPYSGDQMGLFLLPEVGSSVWVEFSEGDISNPLWSGCFWVDKQLSKTDAVAAKKFIKTKSANICIDDDEGSITIEIQNGSSIEMTSSEIKLSSQSITLEAGGKKITLSAASVDVNNGAFTVV